MKLLIVGGTAFVGRAIAWSAWHHGHDVTVLNRGVTSSDLPESIERLVGDRRGDLSALAARSFDATIDVIAYRPSDVERLAAALDDRGGHYIQISSISAYDEPLQPGATEATLHLMSDPDDLEAPIDEATYGPLKAAGERAGIASASVKGPRWFARPTSSVRSTPRCAFPTGSSARVAAARLPCPVPAMLACSTSTHETSRTSWCASPKRHCRGLITSLVPSRPSSSSRRSRRSLITRCARGHHGHSGESDRVLDAHVADKLPLWGLGESANYIEALDSSLAISEGLDLRPLEDSVDDVLEWWGERAWPTRWLTSDEETRLLRR